MGEVICKDSSPLFFIPPPGLLLSLGGGGKQVALIMSDTENTIKKSFNEGFCLLLEYHVTRTFQNSTDKTLKYIWCDGVAMPDEYQLTDKNLMDTKMIFTNAWIGSDGQQQYEMIIHFGPLSFDAGIKGLSLIDYLPTEESIDWINIAISKQKIELQLI